MGKITLFHGTSEKIVVPTYGLGEKKHDYGMGFYLTGNIDLAKEWAVCKPNVMNGWVHQYELGTEGLKILDFQEKLAKYGTVFSLQTYEEALVPRVYHSFKIEAGNADFLEYYFATKLPDRELGKLISSGARMDGLLNIGYDEFMGIQMMFPSIAEQNRVASYFRCLDTFITLHLRKQDKRKKGSKNT